ncbi:MAG TPA: sulfatase [Planctomycetota bacterium]|nr:sulfatase [Planctomycetota bacterium]
MIAGDAVSTPALTAPTATARRPNFIIIFADDLGYGDLSCFGAAKIKTPHLDSLARGGARFTDFYVPASVCTPSRAGLMTGCYPERVGLGVNVLFPYSARGLNPDEITLAELLKKQGYATACIGKWHLGHLSQFLPTHQGFDSYFGIPYSNDMRPSVLMRGETVVEQPVEQDTLTDRYTAEAVKFIDAHKDQPFFLYLPHNMPHVPLHATPAERGVSAGGLYGDVVERIDWSTGEIIAALKKNGLTDNTIVVFTSDNGPWLTQGVNGGSAGPLRDGKGTTYEGGQREPTMMWAPGRIPAGTVCHEVATTLDLYPTFAKLAGAELPADRVIDGRDIAPLMFGAKDAKTPHDAFYYYNVAARIEAIRVGDWKLRIENPWVVQLKANGKQRQRGEPELYNLHDDVGEKQNLAADHPDVVAELRKKMEAFDTELAAHSRPVGEGEQSPEMKAQERERQKIKQQEHKAGAADSDLTD